MAGGSGGMGRFRLGAKRISWPDWVRASAVKSKEKALGSVSNTDIIADAKITVENTTVSIPNSISIAIASGVNGTGNSNSPSPIISSLTVVGYSNAYGSSSTPIISSVIETNNGVGLAKSQNPTIKTIYDTTNGNVKTASPVSTIQTVQNPQIASGQADSSISSINSITDAKIAIGNGESNIGIVTWKAGLGGVVKDPDGNAVQGAEVHIIRDNDNVKVDSLTTNSNGRWHSTLPGGKTTDPDPEVYSIEVWYRDGDKRSKSATVYNAKNRPFIDTANPSEENPYNK